MKTMTLIATALTALALTFGACASVDTSDIQVQAASDASYDLANAKTYAWLGALGGLVDPNGRWKAPSYDIDAELRLLIDTELRDAGFVQVNPERTPPKVVVAYALAVNMEHVERIADSNAVGGVRRVQIPKGALVVQLIDVETEMVVWFGAASAEIKNADEATGRARLAYAVKKIFKEL